MQCVLCPRLRPHSKPRHQEQQACESCTRLLAAIPGHIAEGYPLLSGLLYPWQTSAMYGHRVPSPEPRLPYEADIWDMIYGIPNALLTWTLDWIDRRAMREIGADTIVGIAVWLRERTDWAALQHPAVDEYADQLADIRTRLAGLVGVADGTDDEGRAQPAHQDRPTPIVGVPCWRCDKMTLARTPGSDDVECQNPACRAIRGPADYQRWARLLVAAVNGVESRS